MDPDLLNPLIPLADRLIARPLSNPRGRSLAQQIRKLTQATRTGQPTSATLPAALYAGEAVPPHPHAWNRGRLKITPVSGDLATPQAAAQPAPRPHQCSVHPEAAARLVGR